MRVNRIAIVQKPQRRKLAARLPWLMLGLAPAVVGCGEKRIETFPVSGKVTFQGASPVGAQVVLHPVNRSEASEVAPTGIVQRDGTFKISSYEAADGAPAGDYVATIQWFKLVTEGGGGGRGPNVIPAEYSSAKTSPIKVKVASAPTSIPPITIR